MLTASVVLLLLSSLSTQMYCKKWFCWPIWRKFVQEWVQKTFYSCYFFFLFEVLQFPLSWDLLTRKDREWDLALLSPCLSLFFLWLFIVWKEVFFLTHQQQTTHLPRFSETYDCNRNVLLFCTCVSFAQIILQFDLWFHD